MLGKKFLSYKIFLFYLIRESSQQVFRFQTSFLSEQLKKTKTTLLLFHDKNVKIKSDGSTEYK